MIGSISPLLLLSLRRSMQSQSHGMTPFMPSKIPLTGLVDPIFVLPQMMKPLIFGVSDLNQIIFPRSIPPPATRLVIAGISRNSAGAVLVSCVVKLFRTLDDVLVEQLTSDATTGAYSFSTVGSAQDYYIVAYDPGSPDVSGTTLNTLRGVIG